MKATIVGNLGKDSEMRSTNGGTSVVAFSVAETIGFGDKQTTQWVNCSMFGARAEKLKEYLLKGTKVVVFGDVSVREYQDRNGCMKWSLDCRVDDLKLVGGKKDESAKGNGASPSQEAAGTTFDNDNIPF